MKRKAREDRWTPLGSYAREARCVEKTLAELCAVLVEVRQQVYEAGRMLANEPVSTSVAWKARDAVRNAAHLLSKSPGSLMSSALIAVSVSGRALLTLPAYHVSEHPHSQARALVGELNEAIRVADFRRQGLRRAMTQVHTREDIERGMAEALEVVGL